MTLTLGFRTATRLIRTVLLHGSRVAARPQALVRFTSSRPTQFSFDRAAEKEVSGVQSVEDDQQRPDDSSRYTRNPVRLLDRSFRKFQEGCHNFEEVNRRSYLITFDTYTKYYQEIKDLDEITPAVNSIFSLYGATLLKCCGSLMVDVEPKQRELLAASLWEFLKSNKIPLDTSHYNSLMKVFNDNQTEYDPQIILDEIKKAGLEPDRITYQRLIHRYCKMGDLEKAMTLLETMKGLNMSLSESIFASLITGYYQQSTPPPIDEIFELMRSNNTEPGSQSFTAAIKAQIPNLAKNPPETAELEKLQNMISEDEIHFRNEDMLDLVSSLIPFKSNQSVAKTLRYLQQSCNFRNVRELNKLLRAVLQAGDYKEASRLFWLNKPSEASISRNTSGTVYLKLLVSLSNTPTDFCIEEAMKLKDKGFNRDALHHLFFQSASYGRLDVVRRILAKLEEEGSDVNVQLYWPLLAQSKSKDELVTVLKETISKFKSRSDILETLDLWVWPKFVDNMEDLFKINAKEQLFNKDLLIASLVNYSVQEDTWEKTVKFLVKLPPEVFNSNQSSKNQELEDEGEEDGEGRYSSQYYKFQNGAVAKLLNRILEQTKSPEIVRKTYDLISENHKFTGQALNAVVRAYLMNNDFNKALETFMELAKTHKVTPCKHELMSHCLENKDSENLQKIMDISTEIHGEMNSLFDLAVSCLYCGKTKQAAKILKSPGFRIKPQRIYDFCNIIAESASLKIAEEFVDLTIHLPEIEQEKLYSILLNAYQRNSEPSRALDLWNKMQEQEFHPSRRSLSMIADVLERNNIRVPFQRPLNR